MDRQVRVAFSLMQACDEEEAVREAKLSIY